VITVSGVLFIACKKYFVRRGIILAGFIVCITSTLPAYSQIGAPIPPKPSYKNAMSAGISYGFQNKRDAEFVGWTLDYSRKIWGNWVVAGALAWDTETERIENQQDSVKDTYTLVGTIGYSLLPFLTITAGVGKGIADDDNADNKMQFNNGDNHAGIVLGTVIPVFPSASRYSLGFSVAYEYNLSQEESDYSFDLGIGRSF